MLPDGPAVPCAIALALKPLLIVTGVYGCAVPRTLQNNTLAKSNVRNAGILAVFKAINSVV